MRKILVVFTIFVLVYAVLGYFTYIKYNKVKPVAIEFMHQPILGQPDALVQVIVFQDFKCPGCKYFADHVYTRLKAKYIDTGRVSYIVVPLAFLKGSEIVAHAALCVHQSQPKQFFAYMDRLYEAFSFEDPSWASKENLILYAGDVKNIDLESFKSYFENTSSQKMLECNFKMAKKIMKKVSTPTVFVNGVSESSSFFKLSKQIDRALWEAKK